MSFRKGLHPVVPSRQMVERAKQQNRVGGFVWFSEISGVADGGLESRRFASLLPGLLNHFRGHVDELDVVTVLSEPVCVVAGATTDIKYSQGRTWQEAAQQLLDPDELEFSPTSTESVAFEGAGAVERQKVAVTDHTGESSTLPCTHSHTTAAAGLESAPLRGPVAARVPAQPPSWRFGARPSDVGMLLAVQPGLVARTVGHKASRRTRVRAG